MTCLNSSTETIPALLPDAQRRRAALYQRAAKQSRREEGLDVLRRFARLQGWEIQGEYCDKRTSRERPALQSLLEKAAQGRFEVVLIETLEDLGPSVGRAVLALEKLERTGAALISLDEGLDTTPGCGEILTGLIRALAIFARQCSFKLSRRIERGLRRMQDEGEPVGRPCKGIDVGEVRRLSRERNLSYRAIARLLKIAPSTVCGILKDEGDG